MAHLHSCGSVRCDLKPSSVLLNDQFDPVIGGMYCGGRNHDFMMRRAFVIVSPLFLAPKLAESLDDYDFPVDIFAFAVVIYRLFTDKTIIDDGDPTKYPMELDLGLLHGVRLERAPEIPDAHWALIMRCWNQDPKARPLFRQLLDEFQGGGIMF
jgi:serine/threonine protein kinase